MNVFTRNGHRMPNEIPLHLPKDIDCKPCASILTAHVFVSRRSGIRSCGACAFGYNWKGGHK